MLLDFYVIMRYIILIIGLELIIILSFLKIKPNFLEIMSNFLKIMSIWSFLLIGFYDIIYKFGYGSYIIYLPLILYFIFDNLAEKYNCYRSKQTNLLALLAISILILGIQKCDTIQLFYYENKCSFLTLSIVIYVVSSIIINCCKHNNLDENENSSPQKKICLICCILIFQKLMRLLCLLIIK